MSNTNNFKEWLKGEEHTCFYKRKGCTQPLYQCDRCSDIVCYEHLRPRYKECDVCWKTHKENCLNKSHHDCLLELCEPKQKHEIYSKDCVDCSDGWIY
jgi:hypothetical protein